MKKTRRRKRKIKPWANTLWVVCAFVIVLLLLLFFLKPSKEGVIFEKSEFRPVDIISNPTLNDFLYTIVNYNDFQVNCILQLLVESETENSQQDFVLPMLEPGERLVSNVTFELLSGGNNIQFILDC